MASANDPSSTGARLRNVSMTAEREDPGAARLHRIQGDPVSGRLFPSPILIHQNRRSYSRCRPGSVVTDLG